MKKNSQKRKFGTILLSLAALFAVLFSTAACKTDSDDDELNSVTISPLEATINANGQISLYANVDKKGSGTPVYKWEITSGDKYATLENETSSTCVVTGKNTTASAQSVKVKCTVTFASTTKEAEATVTVSAAKGQVVENKVTSVSVSAEKNSIACDGSTTLTATPVYSGNPEITYTWTISSGSEYAELSESTTETATLTAKNITTAGQTVTVKVSASDGTNSKESTCEVTVGAAAAVETGNVIKASDLPDGWAGINGDSSFGGYGASSSNIYTVSDYSSFISALKCGGKSYSNTKKIIYVSNEIDLNGGKTPYDYIKDAGKGGTYSSYEDWQSKFLATCIKNKASTLASDQSAFHKQQKNQSNIMIPSNTTIIGIADNAGFKNGTLYLKGVSNIVIRNLKVWDSLDYFPPWYQNSENNFNADMDCITVEGSTYVWIDHCTLGDTAHVYDTVSTPAGELSWVNYDALCDITKGSNYVTVSNCQFLNDDKVGLVGSTDNGTTYGDTDKLKVTFHHNYYNNVGQRLPRVRFGQVHVYNNNYDNVSSCCVVVGKSAQIYVENNYFSANAGKAFDVKDTTAGVTSVGNKFVTTKSTTATGIDANWIPSSVSGYVYNADSASDVPSLVNATTVGAGVWTVVK